jgi:hypothetical protein
MDIKKLNNLSLPKAFFITFLPPWIWSIGIALLLPLDFEETVLTVNDIFEIALLAPLLETFLLVGILKVLQVIGVKNYIYQGVLCGFIFGWIHYSAHWISSINAFYSFSIMALIYTLDRSFKKGFLVFFIHCLNNFVSVLPEFIVAL